MEDKGPRKWRGRDESGSKGIKEERREGKGDGEGRTVQQEGHVREGEVQKGVRKLQGREGKSEVGGKGVVKVKEKEW